LYFSCPSFSYEILISKGGIFLDKEFFFPLLVGVFADINIKGDILDLNISRSDMLKNEKYDKLKSRLGDWIFKGLEDFFEEFRGTQTPLGRLNFNLLLEEYKILHPWPDSFINLAREYFDFLVFMKEGICKMEYKELKERKVKIVFIPIFLEKSKSNLSRILKKLSKVVQDSRKTNSISLTGLRIYAYFSVSRLFSMSGWVRF
jgi:hypothetical protein